jgi:hypothetical protein
MMNKCLEPLYEEARQEYFKALSSEASPNTVFQCIANRLMQKAYTLGYNNGYDAANVDWRKGR